MLKVPAGVLSLLALSCVVLGLALSFLLRSMSTQALGSILFTLLFQCLSQLEEPVAWVVQFILIAFSEEVSVQLAAELEHASAFFLPPIAQGPLLQEFPHQARDPLAAFKISCRRLGKEEAGDVRDASLGVAISDFMSVCASRLRSGKRSSRLQRCRVRVGGWMSFCFCGRRSLGKGQSWDKLASCLASNSSSSQRVWKYSAVHGLQ